jgi:hypothetical protein
VVVLCGISVVFNLLDDVFALVSCQHTSENPQVLMGFQSTEALGRFQDAGGCPAQCHRGIAPTLHVATDPTHCPHHVLDRVGAAERTPDQVRLFLTLKGRGNQANRRQPFNFNVSISVSIGERRCLENARPIVFGIRLSD